MATRTFAEIVNDLIVYILRQNQKTDISPGQVIRDVSINAPASVAEGLYSDIEQVRVAQSILNANIMSTQDLNNLVANYGATRKTSTSANCSVVFYSPVQPLSDFQIPAGTKVATSPSSGSPQIVFITLASIQFIAAFESTYYNPNTGNWEITANVQAQQGGTSGNVGPFTINSVLNFDIPFQVTNRIAATGGSNQESNQDLATRTINSYLGNNKGTKDGYIGTVLAQPNVTDALVQGPGDPIMVRDGGQGGKVDIWTLVTNAGSTQLDKNNNSDLSFLWQESQQSLQNYTFNFPLLPVDVNSVLTVNGTTFPNNPLNSVILYEKSFPAPSGIPYINQGEFHYTFNKANNLDTAHSVLADDNIIWNPVTMESLRIYPSGQNTANSLQVDITYSYDSTVQSLQSIIDASSNKIITADVLIKEAIEVTIDVQASINLDPQYKQTPNTETQTVNSVITAITDYINNNKMGTKLEKSDIVQVAHNVTGVDNVVLSSVIITRSLNPVYGIATAQVENTSALANEYLSAGTITISSVVSSV